MDTFKIKTFCFFTIVCLFFLLVVPCGYRDGGLCINTPAYAQGVLDIEGAKIRAGLELQETWDDNIYNAPNDEKSDSITTIVPGVSVSAGTNYKLDAGYTARIHQYQEYNDEDYTSHTANAQLNLNSPMGLSLNVKELYIDTKDPRSETGGIRASHWLNSVSCGVGYEFPGSNLLLEVNVSQFYLKYDQSVNEPINRKEESIGATVYYKFFPKTSALVELSTTMTDYFDSPSEATDKDSQKTAVNAGLKWDATAKISGRLQAGWAQKSFDNSLDPSGYPYEDKDIGSVSGNIAYAISETTRLRTIISRSMEETEYGGNAVYSRSSYYTNTGLSLALALRVINRVDVDITAGYHAHEYDNLDPALLAREDDVSHFGIGLTYRIRRWLYAGLSYDYEDTDSNDDSRDQLNNKTMLRIGAAL
ncbi:MAG: outer membrane beta-barrel protein [bacterium]